MINGSWYTVECHLDPVVCVNTKGGAFALKSFALKCLSQKAQSFLPTLSCYSVLSCCTTCPLKLTLQGKFQQPLWLTLRVGVAFEPATSTRDEVAEYCIHHYGSPVSFWRPPQCLVPSLPDQVRQLQSTFRTVFFIILPHLSSPIKIFTVHSTQQTSSSSLHCSSQLFASSCLHCSSQLFAFSFKSLVLSLMDSRTLLLTHSVSWKRFRGCDMQ